MRAHHWNGHRTPVFEGYSKFVGWDLLLLVSTTFMAQAHDCPFNCLIRQGVLNFFEIADHKVNLFLAIGLFNDIWNVILDDLKINLENV